MILVAAGDSFTWGSELKDSPNGGPNGYSHCTYPALLAQHFKMNYVCAAYPGNSNSAISRMALDALVAHKDAVLLTTWTYPQRAEFRFGNKWTSINSWHTAEPEFSKQYFRHVGDNEYYELYSTLKEIVFLQYYCQQNNIRYMFMTADNTFYCHENYLRSQDIGLNNLYSAVDWSQWFWFDPGNLPNETLSPRGFYQWAVENKYACGSQGHPLEQAHADAADLIKDRFNELVIKNL